MKPINPINITLAMIIAFPSIVILMIWAFLTRWFK